MRAHAITKVTAIAASSLLSLWTLSACGEGASPTNEADSAPPVTSPAEGSPLKYVALGDSYASMATRDAIDPTAPYCLRSEDNYAAQLAALLKTSVTDVSCQGGVTGDVTSPRITPDGELPPQADALGEDTTLVTVTMGGNDIGFGDLAMCASNPNLCSPELLERTSAKIEELPAALKAMYAAIREKAPNAQIVATGYLPLIAEGDQCPFIAPLNADVRKWFVRATSAINHAVKEAAESAGAIFVLPSGANDHTGCASGTERWTAFTSQDSDAYAMHPTPEGQAAMAVAIREAIIKQ